MRRSFMAAGQRWRIKFVSRSHPELTDDDEGTSEGACDFDQCVMYIANDLALPAREEVFIHELEHIINRLSGARHEMGLRFQLEKSIARHEERLVRARTPLLHRTLKDLGFRFPKGLLR